MFRRHIGDGAESMALAGDEFCGGITTQVIGGGGDFGLAASGNENLGQAEIQNLGVTAFGDKNVGGLDVAMNDALSVSSVESIGNFNGQRKQYFGFDRFAINAMFQRDAIQKFHGDEGLGVLLADVINGADVGMIQSGSGLRFALKKGQ